MDRPQQGQQIQTKSGYTFDGWYEEDTFTTEFDFTTPITADTTVYAKFTA